MGYLFTFLLKLYVNIPASRVLDCNMKALCSGHMDFSVFNVSCRCCLQQQNIASLYKEQSTAFGTACIIWKFLAIHLTSNGVRWNYSQYRNLHLVLRGVKLGLCLPHYMAIPFRFFSNKYIYSKLSLSQVSTRSPQKVLNSSLFNPYSLPSLPLSSASPFDSHPSPSMSVLFPLSKEIYSFHLVSYSLPKPKFYEL